MSIEACACALLPDAELASLYLPVIKQQPDKHRGDNTLLCLLLGSTAHQTLNLGDTISTRTVEVSYLSAGHESLSVGKHTIAMTAKAEGDFLQLAIPKGLHVIWFD